MSRRDARSRSLRRRPSRTVPAVLVAVVLMAFGALTAFVTLSRLVDGKWPNQVPDAASAVAGLTWGAAPVLVAGAVLTLLGVVLLVAGVKPGALSTAPLEAGSPAGAVDETDFVISTRSLARVAAASAEQVDGVDGVSASASGRRVRLTVTTTSEQRADIRQAVRDAVTERLAATGVRPVPQVVATVRTKGI